MRIIQQPPPTKEWGVEVHCVGVPDVREGCGAVLEIGEDDLFSEQCGNTGLEYHEAMFSCPICGVRTVFHEYVNPAVLPEWAVPPNAPIAVQTDKGIRLFKVFQAELQVGA